MIRHRGIGCWAAMFLLAAIGTSQASEMGTHFTYQGRLIKNGTPIGSPSPVVCDMTFGLWDAATMGNQIGLSPIGPLTISVTGGLFNANLSFGAEAINGQARWLEIEVQCPGDGSATTLTPRQQLRPAPHALALPGLYTIQNSFSPNLIGGKFENAINPGVSGATISGGGAAVPDNNRVTDTFGTISGGCSNRAGNDAGSPLDTEFATVSGGFSNIAGGAFSTVGGGEYNEANNFYATVSGGGVNVASGNSATISGGGLNTASGTTATIGGGSLNNASNSYSTIGGGISNNAMGNRSTIGGGDSNTASGGLSSVGGGSENTASADQSSVSGGHSNSATGFASHVGGGNFNTAGGDLSTVGGGILNNTGDEQATVGGGYMNAAIGSSATICGGVQNIATGNDAMIPGGQLNQAGGDFSFAAGRQAKVRNATQSGDPNGDEGTFIWADSSDAELASTGPNQFLVRASGVTRFFSNSTATVGVQLFPGDNSWSAMSDRNVKENFITIDPREILQRVAELPVTIWNLKSQISDIKRIGPMAQDFHAAFGVGESDTHISNSDADGVALAAIQGLHGIVVEKESEISDLRSRAMEKDCEIDDLRERLKDVSKRNVELEERVIKIETLLLERFDLRNEPNR